MRNKNWYLTCLVQINIIRKYISSALQPNLLIRSLFNLRHKDTPQRSTTNYTKTSSPLNSMIAPRQFSARFMGCGSEKWTCRKVKGSTEFSLGALTTLPQVKQVGYFDPENEQQADKEYDVPGFWYRNEGQLFLILEAGKKNIENLDLMRRNCTLWPKS